MYKKTRRQKLTLACCWWRSSTFYVFIFSWAHTDTTYHQIKTNEFLPFLHHIMMRYRAMNDNDTGQVTDHASCWDEEKLGAFLCQQGLGDYTTSLLKKHRITGRLAPLLSDEDLKDMGFTIVGDRLMFRHYLTVLSRQTRFKRRVESIWESEERIFFSTCDRNCWTLCGLCPVDPSTYKLTSSHLKVKKVQPVRCGPIPLCCFGATYRNSNIDLSKVDDVDVMGVPAPCGQRVCCCASGKDLVQVESRFEKGGGKIMLTLEEGKGDMLANLILNQVDESQKMERS